MFLGSPVAPGPDAQSGVHQSARLAGEAGARVSDSPTPFNLSAAPGWLSDPGQNNFTSPGLGVSLPIALPGPVPGNSVRSVALVLSSSLLPYGLQPTRPLCPWDSPGKSTGVSCHALLQGLSPTQRSNAHPRCHRQILHRLSHQGSRSGNTHRSPTSEVLERFLRFLGLTWHLPTPEGQPSPAPSTPREVPGNPPFIF